MPTTLPLVPVLVADLPKVPGLPSAKEHKTVFPKTPLAGAAAAKTAFRKWQDAQLPLAGPANPDLPFKAVTLDASRLAQLRAVLESDVAPAEMLKQKLDGAGFLGLLYSALAVYEFMQLESEYKRRALTTPGDKTNRQWAAVVQASQLAFGAGGLSTIDAATLSQAARALAGDKRALDAIVRVAATGSGSQNSVLDGQTKTAGAFVPIVDNIRDPAMSVTHIANLCTGPLVAGRFTKHFSQSFALSVRLRVWCPTFTNPFLTCLKTFVVAGVNFSVALDVSYRVGCCDASAWGQAHAQTCATVVGVSVCAACTATVTGVSGVSRTTIPGGCSYALGLTAVLTCTLFGQTLFTANTAFGYTVTAPCPPVGLCA
jgi:hypothetical protein